MNDISGWLERYDCGPGRHDFQLTGVEMMPMAQVVQDDGRIDTSSSEELTACTRCQKPGWSRTLTCEICEHYPAEIMSGRLLVLGDGTVLNDVPLCSMCHLAVLDEHAGLSITWATS
jgi:hypothetical protein